MVNDPKKRDAYLRETIDLFRNLEHIVEAIVETRTEGGKVVQVPDAVPAIEELRKGIGTLAGRVQTTLMQEAKNAQARYVADHHARRRVG